MGSRKIKRQPKTAQESKRKILKSSTLKDHFRKLHQFIEQKNFEGTENIIEAILAYENIECDEEKKRALTAALKITGNFKIYVLLWSKGFQRDVICNDLLKKLENKHIARINNLNRFAAVDLKSYIDTLKNNVQMVPDNSNKEKCVDVVKMWLEKLDKIPEVQIIMKLVAKEEHIKIVFDFNYQTVSNFDTSQHGSNTYARATYGVNISVAAKDHETKNDEIMANIAHELTHYAINMVFEDVGNPFFKGEAHENEFAEIVKNCMKKCKIYDKLINYIDTFYKEYHIVRSCNVDMAADSLSTWIEMFWVENNSLRKGFREFKQKLLARIEDQKRISCYKKFRKLRGRLKQMCRDEDLKLVGNDVIKDGFDEYIKKCHAEELIARVPHLIVLSTKKELKNLKKEYKDLFDYFNQYVLQKISEETPKFAKPRSFIRKLNKDFGTYERERIICSQKKEIKGKEVMEQDYVHIYSEVPEMVFSEFIRLLKKKKMRNIKSSYIFIDYAQFITDSCYEKIDQAVHSFVKPKLIILHDSVTGLDEIFKIVKWMELSSRVVLISKQAFPEKAESQNQFTTETLEHQWSELDPKSQENVLETKIIFFGHEMTLNSIVGTEVTSNTNGNLSLGDVLKLKDINKPSLSETHPLTKYFVDRTVRLQKDPEPEIETKKMEEIVQFIREKKYIIIDENAGGGKTTFATKLAIEYQEKFTKSWTIFVELKKYTQYFAKNGADLLKPIDSDFVRESFVTLENKIMVQLFNYFYGVKKETFFVFDGFDEISPDYKDFVLQVLREVQMSGNRLLVTTRKHLTAEIQEKIGAYAIKMVPYDKIEKIKFLQNCMTDIFKKETQDEHNIRIQNFFKNLDDIYDNAELLAVPSLLSMFTKLLCEKETNSQEGLYSTYQSSVENLILMWTEKDPLVSKDIVKLISSEFNLIKLHQKMALEYFFDRNMIESLCLPVLNSTVTKELISRVGIVRMLEDDTTQPVHLSFLEFLVAKLLLTSFMSRNLLSSNENLHHIFCNILSTSSSAQFVNVQKFLNDGLGCMKASYENSTVQLDSLSNAVELTLNSEILEHLVEKNLSHLHKFVLFGCGLSERFKKELLENSLDNLRFLNNFRSFECLKTIWECVETVYGKNDQERILNRQYVLFVKNALFAAVHPSSSETVLQFVISKSINVLGREIFLNSLLSEQTNDMVLVMSAFNTEFPAFYILWREIENTMAVTGKTDILINFADKFETRTVTDKMDAKVPGFVCEAFEKLYLSNGLADADIKTRLFRAILSWLLRFSDITTLEKFWNFVATHDLESIKQILIENNPNGKNLLEHSYQNKNKEIVLFLFAKALELENSNFENLFRISDFNNLLSSVSLLDALMENRPEYLINILDPDNSQYFLHHVALRASPLYSRKLFEFAKRSFENLAPMLLRKNRNEHIPLQCVLLNTDCSTLDVFWHYYMEELGPKIPSQEVLLPRNPIGLPNNILKLQNFFAT